jgi:hypothetical protein
METARIPETSASTKESARRLNPKHHQHRYYRENLKYYNLPLSCRQFPEPNNSLPVFWSHPELDESLFLSMQSPWWWRQDRPLKRR